MRTTQRQPQCSADAASSKYKMKLFHSPGRLFSAQLPAMVPCHTLESEGGGHMQLPHHCRGPSKSVTGLNYL